jgi:hypothetical protein
LIKEVQNRLCGDHGWQDRVRRTLARASRNRVHLAIFTEPYLEFLLNGKKTVESRFSITRRAPYGKVDPQDILILKKASGPICGACEVASVWSYKVDLESLREIRERFAEGLCADESDFWTARRSCRFATLMLIANVTRLKPFMISKQDRRGWVVLEGKDDY